MARSGMFGLVFLSALASLFLLSSCTRQAASPLTQTVKPEEPVMALAVAAPAVKPDIPAASGVPATDIARAESASPQDAKPADSQAAGKKSANANGADVKSTDTKPDDAKKVTDSKAATNPADPVKPADASTTGKDAVASKTDVVNRAMFPKKLAGLDVLTVEDILKSSTNPFLNKMPIEEVQVTDSGKGTSEVKVDSFAGIHLKGVMYNPAQPMALLMVDELSGSNPQVVKKGGLIVSKGNVFMVTDVTKNSITVQKGGSGKEKRSMFLADIVGFNSRADNPGAMSSDAQPTSGDLASKSGPTSGVMNGLLDNITESKPLEKNQSNASILQMPKDQVSKPPSN